MYRQAFGLDSVGQFWNRILTDLLDWQLQQLWQAGCQHSNEKWGGGAADVQHAGWQHRNEGVLPGEGVQQRQHCMATPGQHTAVNRGQDKRRHSVLKHIMWHSCSHTIVFHHIFKVTNCKTFQQTVVVCQRLIYAKTFEMSSVSVEKVMKMLSSHLQTVSVSLVVSLFKKNSRSDVGNYKPVWILPTISKLLERVVYDRVEEYFIQHNLLYEFQSKYWNSLLPWDLPHSFLCLHQIRKWKW